MTRTVLFVLCFIGSILIPSSLTLILHGVPQNTLEVCSVLAVTCWLCGCFVGMHVGMQTGNPTSREDTPCEDSA